MPPLNSFWQVLKSINNHLFLIISVFVVACMSSLPPSRAMTPAEQLDIIRSFEEVESMDDDRVSERDLEVSHHKTSY